MKAFVQVEDGEFPSPNMYNAWRAFKLMGYEVIPFEGKFVYIWSHQTPWSDMTKETPIFAGVQVFNKILKALKIKHIELESYPDCLSEFFGRKIYENQIGNIRYCIEKYGPVFIKPIDEDRKLFHGHVVRESKDLVHTVFLPDNHYVLASELVDFESEYRVFIHKGKILDARHYKGNFRKIIDFNVVDNAIAKFSGAPVAYCLDFGLTKQGQTLLVEVTDAFSFGHYGLDTLYYGRMIVDRWEEIMQDK